MPTKDAGQVDIGGHALKYFNSKKDLCPLCGSDDIVVDKEDGGPNRKFHCNDCGGEAVEQYARIFMRIEPLAEDGLYGDESARNRAQMIVKALSKTGGELFNPYFTVHYGGLVSLGTNFDLRLTKDQAIYFLQHDLLRAGVAIMCREYGDDDDWVEVTKDDLETLKEGDEYQTFEIYCVTHLGG